MKQKVRSSLLRLLGLLGVLLSLVLGLSGTNAQAFTFGNTGGGSGPGTACYPEGVAVDQPTGDVYVADSCAQRVDVFSASGHFLFAFGWGVRDNSHELQVCTVTSGCTGGIFASAAGAFAYPSSLALERSAGQLYVYVVEFRNQRVEKFRVSPEEQLVEFDLMIGGEVDQGPHHPGNLCTAAYLAEGDTCGEGTTGSANGQFSEWFGNDIGERSNLIAAAAGTVYVADLNRVQEFDPEGHYTGELSLSGAGKVRAIAVNSAGDIYLAAPGLANGVHEYEPSGSEISGLDLPLDSGGEPTALALDAADELFVRDVAGGTAQVLGYEAGGGQDALIPAREVKGNGTGPKYVTGGLALGESAGILYLSDPWALQIVGLPLPPPGPAIDGESESAAQVLATRATLEARINPQSHPTTFHLQYVDLAEFEAHGFAECGLPANPECHTTAESASIGSDFILHTATETISGLTPETAYRYRFVASNEKGTVSGEGATFTTNAPALFALQSPTQLTATGVQLHVYLNPMGESTNYSFEYTEQAHFEAEGFANAAATPVAGAGEGTAFALQSNSLSGLQPGTRYQFRTVAANAAGTVASPPFAFTTPPSVCSNEALRAEDDSLKLGQCRAYEQVSPVDKGGYQVRQIGVASSGGRILFKSLGTFAGNPSDEGDYLSRRGPSGWATEGVDPPLALGAAATGAAGAAVQFASEDLGRFVSPPITPGLAESERGTATSAAFFYREPPAGYLQTLPTLERTDHGRIESAVNGGTSVSPDLSHLVLRATAPLLPEDTYPPAPAGQANANPRLYQIEAAGTAAASLHLISVDGSGHVLEACVSTEGTGGNFTGNTLGGVSGHARAQAISRDGSTIFFSAYSPQLLGGCETPENWQLLARRGGQTFDLSHPSPGECGEGSAPAEEACRTAPLAGADFAGASEDGSKAFFLSSQQLTARASEDVHTKADGITEHFGCAAAKPVGTGCNLYMYDFAKPAAERLTALSAGDSSGFGPQVRGVLGASVDGSHVYFLAGGVLDGTRPNRLGQVAVAGADNLYVANTETGGVSFIADLCRGEGRSGSLGGFASCPGSGDDEPNLLGTQLALGTGLAFGLNPDGRYLLFETYAQLTPDDRNSAADVYRYDAATGALIRLSTGHDGFDENGNNGGQDASITSAPELLNLPHRIVSDDGEAAVFFTARPLQAGDENGQIDAYLWDQGEVTLLSGGVSRGGSGEDANISPSGRDVFFSTDVGLIPSDGDGLRDVYDARAGGGFPQPEGAPPACESAETCHGPPTDERLRPSNGTEANQHGPEPVRRPCRKGYRRRNGHCVKLKHHRRHRKSRSSRGGRR